jgi:lysophospholipase L1-like esterase
VGRFSVVLIAVAGFAALTAGCHEKPNIPPPAPITLANPTAGATPVAIIGDSYTCGTMGGGSGDKGWPYLAARQMKDSGLNVKPAIGCEGGSGYAVKGIEAGAVFADQVPRVIKPEDKLVVFFGSLNDAEANPAEVPTAIRDTLTKARQAAPDAKLLVIGPPWIRPGAPPDQLLQLEKALGTEAQAAGATFVDPVAEQWFAGQPEYLAQDGIHPTDAGHQVIADKIGALMQAQLAPAPAG